MNSKDTTLPGCELILPIIL